jgi:hypothetical protein
MTWIRLDVEMPTNTKTLCFRDRLSIPMAQAVGHLSLLFMWLAREHWDGHVGKVPDEHLEIAAMWNGSRGDLATAFRDYFCDGKGMVTGWLERQGKLVAYKNAASKRRKVS